MGIDHALAVLRARFYPLLAVILVTMGITALLSLLLPPRYTATVTLVVDSSRNDPVTGASLPALLRSDYLNTQLEVIASHAVALKVVKALKLGEDPKAEELWLEETGGRGSIKDWMAGRLLKRLKTELGRESNVITLSYESSSPERAATIANAFAEAFVETNLELRVAPAREASRWFGAQIKQLKDNLERAQTRLSEYQRTKGIVSTDDRFDIENTRLSELSGQLALAQSQAIEAVSRKRQLDQYFKDGRNTDALPDAVGNSLINSLKQQLSMAEAKLTQLAGQLGKNHPEFQRSSAEVEQIKRQLNIELETLAASISNTARVAQAKEAELRAAVATQKARVLDLNKEKGRDDLTLLMRDVETAQKAYDSAAQRSNEASLESQISQTYVVILNPAIPPLKPSFPDWTINMFLSFVLGSMLGVSLAFMMERSDRRVRAREDLAEIPGLTVFGVLRNTARLKGKEGSRRFFPVTLWQRAGAP